MCLDAIVRKARESAELISSFVTTCAPALERASLELAARLRLGGRLYVMGTGGSACDAQHAAVEFQHPILEERKAFPARSLSMDVAQLELVAGAIDIALGISTSGTAANVVRALRRARALGMCTIGFAGRGGSLAEVCEHAFVVPSASIHRVQEVHTVLLHLLWDQVHIAMGEPDVL